jgi:hypothetical protein
VVTTTWAIARNPHSLDDIVELVVPELQRRGLFRTAYSGTTERGCLVGYWGLPLAVLCYWWAWYC